jgi:M6 family metalloprotease-like protein
MPTTGDVKILTLLISFKDYPATNSAAAVHDKLFGAGDHQAFPYESLRSYYQRSSYDKLHISGDVLGWYQTPYDRDQVPQTDQGREALIEEALRYYDAQGHDFSQYDNDGDGAIDYLVVVWTGPDTGWSGFWWGYMTNFADSSFALDGKSLGTYSWQWEANPAGGSFDPRVVIHETGHALGLPDLYDYDDTVGPSGGVGGLDMMDANWGDHNCFSKFLLGWLTPQTIAAGSQAVTLSSSGTSGDALLVMPHAVGGDPFGEFFMMQNRHPVANDTGLPGDGLLIWHVDARLNAAGTDYLYDNSYTSHKLLRLMEADGRDEIEKNMTADAADYYAAGDTFGRATAPNSSSYDGSQSGVAAGGLGVAGASLAFTAGVDASPDTTPPVTTSSADAKWHRVAVRVSFRASDDLSGVRETRINPDGKGWSVASSFRVLAPKTHANDGVHSIHYYSVDNAGNAETEKSCVVRIDTLGPTTLAPKAASGKVKQYVTLTYRVKDALSPQANVIIRIKNAAGTIVKSTSASGVATNKLLSKRLKLSLPAGVYRFYVYARDLAGNPQTAIGNNRLTLAA